MAGKVRIEAPEVDNDDRYAFSTWLQLPSPLDLRMHAVHGEDEQTPDGHHAMTKFYAAADGEKFEVKVELTKNNKPNAAAEYGARIFIDHGPEPPDYNDDGNPNWDHDFSWGHPSKQGFQQKITINGFAQGGTQTKSFVFAKADKSAAGEEGTDHKAVGWIVLRYYRVTGYRAKTEPDSAPVPKRARVDRERYAKSGQMSAQAGPSQLDAFLYDPTIEPIFDETPVFESRIRFMEWSLLKREINGSVDTLDKGILLAIPFDAFEDQAFRARVIFMMLHKCLNEFRKPSSAYTKLEHIIKMLNLHFDSLGAKLLCCASSADLKRQASRAVLQGDPVAIQDVDEGLDDFDEDKDFELKLSGLYSYLTRDPNIYDMTIDTSAVNASSSITGRGFVVRTAIIHLVPRGSHDAFCIHVGGQDANDLAIISVNAKTTMAEIQEAYFRKKMVPRCEEQRYRFLFDGDRLHKASTLTVEDYEMEEDMQIDVMVEQHGGF